MSYSSIPRLLGEYVGLLRVFLRFDLVNMMPQWKRPQPDMFAELRRALTFTLDNSWHRRIMGHSHRHDPSLPFSASEVAIYCTGLPVDWHAWEHQPMRFLALFPSLLEGVPPQSFSMTSQELEFSH